MDKRYGIPYTIRNKWGGVYLWLEIPWWMIEAAGWEPDSHVKLIRGRGEHRDSAAIIRSRRGCLAYKLRPIPNREWSEVYINLAKYELASSPPRGEKGRLVVEPVVIKRSLLIRDIPEWLRVPE